MKYFEETFGVNTTEVDSNLKSPMHIVCEHGHLEMFTFLMNKGVRKYKFVHNFFYLYRHFGY